MKDLLKWCEGKTLGQIANHLLSNDNISVEQYLELKGGTSIQKAQYLYNKVNRSKTMTKEEALKKIEELKQFIESEDKNNKPIELVKYITINEVKDPIASLSDLKDYKPTLLFKDYDGYDLILFKGNWFHLLYLGHWNSGRTE